MSPGHSTVPALDLQSRERAPGGCPVSEVLERVGDKWSVLLVVQLVPGPRRFSDLLRGTEGISRRMLTRTLRLLERDGLVQRTVYPTVPPAVEYAITPLGTDLARPLEALAEWALANRDRVQAARAAYDGRDDPVAGVGVPGIPAPVRTLTPV